MELFINLFGIALGVTGIGYAVYESRQSKKLSDYIRAHNWFNFQRVNTTSSLIQKSKTLYKEKHKDNLDPEIFEYLANADAFSQEIYKEMIKQIHYFEPSFSAKDFERWKKEGKITETEEAFFKKFAIEVYPN